MSRLGRARRAPIFSVGDRVLFTYIKGPRKVVVPVVIAKVGVWLGEISDGDLVNVEVLSYMVTSGRGGELRVDPSELRPDTVLDRIAVALDAAE
jgi:hypothetical protein